jgi:FkbM family methyltransferase
MLQKIIPEKYKGAAYKLKQKVLGSYFNKSYSQEGEDMVLHRMMGSVKNGFYVDVGAHHPLRFSNTYFFYQKGWRGINIDAMPGSMDIFKHKRGRDINLEVAVAEKPEELTFYIFEEPAINSFDADLSEKRIKDGNILVEKKVINTKTLEQILDENLPKNQTIDFISIDVEGFDLMILRSNNWSKYKPNIVAVECLGFDIVSIQNDAVYKFLIAHGYNLVAKTVNTCFFQIAKS